MPVEIRALDTVEDCRRAEHLQRDAWGLDDIRIISSDVLITIQRNGGVLLGAFDEVPRQHQTPPRLVGYLMGFVGLREDGALKHCSHQMGVLPAYRDQHIGYRLKVAQRERVLAQGIDLITWTYDPLESRNAYLNIHKLGAVCNTYKPDAYGPMRDTLNRGLLSDRFEVDWHLASQHVAARLGGQSDSPSLATLREAGVPLLNTPPPATPAPEEDVRVRLPLEHERLLVQIPASFQDIKIVSLEAALAWRQQSRLLFETAFAAGYTVVDLLRDEQHSYYLLEKHWSVL